MEAPLAPPTGRTRMVDKVFLEHPRALGETYWQHQRRALQFGTSMISGGLACLLHALIPAIFVRTASTTIARLHEQMHAARRLGHGPQDRLTEALRLPGVVS
jgi:hypothetical protein